MKPADALSKAKEKWFSDDIFTEALTYNGSPISGHVVLGEESSEFAKNGRIIVQRSEVPDPKYRDVIVEADGTTWSVFSDGAEAIIRGDMVVWELPVIRKEGVNLI